MQRWSSGFRICKASSISSAGVFITTLPSSHTPMSVYVVMVRVVIMVMVIIMVVEVVIVTKMMM